MLKYAAANSKVSGYSLVMYLAIGLLLKALSTLIIPADEVLWGVVFVFPVFSLAMIICAICVFSIAAGLLQKVDRLSSKRLFIVSAALIGSISMAVAVLQVSILGGYHVESPMFVTFVVRWFLVWCTLLCLLILPYTNVWLASARE